MNAELNPPKNRSDFMNIVEDKAQITQAEYAKKLCPLLLAEAFASDPNKLVILVISLAILILGWEIASKLNQQETTTVNLGNFS